MKTKPSKRSKDKRISFDFYRAAHLYELSLEHFCVGKKGNCFTCENVKERLEKFLGKKDVEYTKRLLRKRGYCNKLKKSPVITLT